MRRLSFFLFLLFPVLALAQAVQPVPPASQILISLLTSLLTPEGLGIAFVAVSAVLGFFGVKSVIWKQRFALLVKHGFNFVEDLNSDPALAGKLDKEAAGLKAVNDLCLANGWRVLKPGEVEVAKLQFKAMNGAAEAEEAIRTKSIIAAAAAAPTTPDQAAAIVAGLK